MNVRSLVPSNRPAAFLALFCLLSLVFSAIHAAYLVHLMKDDARERLLACSAKETALVQTTFDDRFAQLELLAASCSGLPDREARLSRLSDLFGGREAAACFGLAENDGRVYFLDSRQDVLTGELRDAVESGVPRALTSARLSPDALYELVYLVPLSRDDPAAGALLYRDADPFWEHLAPNSSENPILVREDGQILLPGRSGEVQLSLFQLAGDSAAEAREQLSADLAARRTGTLSFRFRGSHLALAAAPLETEGWFLVSFLDLDANRSSLLQALVLSLAIDLVLLLVFLSLFLLYRRGQRQTLRHLEHAAFVDPVTGGDNQTRFSLRAQELLRTRPPGTYALVSCDIQAFSLINRSFGEAAGNRVLCHLHACLKQKLRSGELAARVAQDQFILLLFQSAEEDMRARMEETARYFNAFNRNLRNPYYLPLAFGICPAGDPSLLLSDLCDRANLARKRAKRLPGGTLCSCAFYQPADRQRLLLDLDISNRMESALERGEFQLYLQPKVSLSTRSVVGAEALVRWRDPQGGFVEPDVFIPVLERNGFITQLDLYMFEQSCLCLRRWMDCGVPPLPISVNFSRVNLGRDILSRFRQLQEKWSVPPELLEFEFTETLVAENPQFFAELVQEIHRCGFHCSIDDFGSGYSSLHMLQQVPADTLKLDKSLFDGLLDADLRPRSELVVRSVLEMARQLGMTTVAEGISEEAQLSALERLPCDMVQGYYFSRPLPADEFYSAFLQPPESGS